MNSGNTALCGPASSGFPGGYCTQTCSTAAPCPSSSSCSPYVAGTSGQSFCLADCPSAGGGQSTCRPGYVCNKYLIPSNPNQGSCWVACTADSECNASTPSAHCQSGYCCGRPGFKCCVGTTPACVASDNTTVTTCQTDGYCPLQ